MSVYETLTPAQRSLRARIASNTAWANCPDRTAKAKNAQRGLLARFEREVDPDGVLPDDERLERAKSARRAHMSRLAYEREKNRANRTPKTK